MSAQTWSQSLLAISLIRNEPQALTPPLRPGSPTLLAQVTWSSRNRRARRKTLDGLGGHSRWTLDGLNAHSGWTHCGLSMDTRWTLNGHLMDTLGGLSMDSVDTLDGHSQPQQRWTFVNEPGWNWTVSIGHQPKIEKHYKILVIYQNW